MKALTQLFKTSLTAAIAFFMLALPGCHKEEQAATSPTDTPDASQPENTQVPTVSNESTQNEPLPSPENEQDTAAQQDMQMLKDVADKALALDTVSAAYGPAEALPNAPLQEDAPNVAADNPSKKVTSHKQEQRSIAMDAMLAKGLDMDNLDWSSFDPERERTMAAYYGPSLNDEKYYRDKGLLRNNTIGAQNQAKVTVKLQTPVVTGSLDKRIIRKVVNNHIGELRACYEKELTKTKDLLGKVVFEWIINPDGNVSIVIIQSSSLNNKNMESCLLNSIKFWRFPAPKGGGMAKVEFPISFTCESAEYYRAHPKEMAKPKPDLGCI